MVWFIFSMIGLFILILISRIYVSFTLLFTDQKKQISVKLILFRIRIFKKTFPLKAENINVSSSSPIFERFSPKLHNLMESLKLIRETLMIILRKIKLHRLKWVTEGGTGSAASTGVSAGGIWTIKGMTVGFLGNMMQLKCHPVIQVIPDYQNMYFRSTMDCMVSVQIVQAIHIIFKIIRLLFSRKPEKAVSAS